MRTLSTDELLSAWEQGRAEPQLLRRALILVWRLYPDVPFSALADLTIGARDSLLLAFRKQVFGSHLAGLIDCPSCRQTMEVQFDMSTVLAAPAGHEPLVLCDHDYALEFRLPSSRDLLAIADRRDLAEKRSELLGRVIIKASHGAEPVSSGDLPEPLLAQLEQALGDADPQADVRLRLNCAACGHEWQSVFDIASFLWRELDAWAIRLLRDVHTLASTYGWREADILQMRPLRRQSYLEMVVG
jgi:hypothetical protein